ncbi:MAG: carbohydrate porin [Pirellulaceae bacterium]|nr:carbohydrate porin [Pirellulaceae bacterium]
MTASNGGVGRLLMFLVIAAILPATAASGDSQDLVAQEQFQPATHGDAGCSAGDACPEDCLWTRPTMTGDWHGYRTCWEESGITFAGRSTQMGFGLDGGIFAPVTPSLLGSGDTFKYTGRGEYDLRFDLEKLGGLTGGRMLVRVEHWYGEFGNVSLHTGALTPAVFPALLPVVPNREGELFMTNFRILQPLSEQLVVFAGKTDVLGEVDQTIFAGGDGTEQFINQAFVANPAFLLGLPYSSFTAGFVLPRQWGRIGMSVLDPRDRTEDFFRLDDLYATGAVVVGEVYVNTNFFNLPGQHHVGGIWKHKDQIDLRFNFAPPGEYPYPTPPGPLETKSDAFTIYYGFDQFVQEYSDDPKRGWGLFGRASVSDGNPTPIRYHLSLGIGGYSNLRPGRDDTFGIGWYYTVASDEFGDLPREVLDPQDGTGVELYYNFQVTPWLNVTPDIQFIRPGNRAIANDAVIYGLRMVMTL